MSYYLTTSNPQPVFTVTVVPGVTFKLRQTALLLTSGALALICAQNSLIPARPVRQA